MKRTNTYTLHEIGQGLTSSDIKKIEDRLELIQNKKEQLELSIEKLEATKKRYKNGLTRINTLNTTSASLKEQKKTYESSFTKLTTELSKIQEQLDNTKSQLELSEQELFQEKAKTEATKQFVNILFKTSIENLGGKIGHPNTSYYTEKFENYLKRVFHNLFHPLSAITIIDPRFASVLDHFLNNKKLTAQEISEKIDEALKNSPSTPRPIKDKKDFFRTFLVAMYHDGYYSCDANIIEKQKEMASFLEKQIWIHAALEHLNYEGFFGTTETDIIAKLARGEKFPGRDELVSVLAMTQDLQMLGLPKIEIFRDFATTLATIPFKPKAQKESLETAITHAHTMFFKDSSVNLKEIFSDMERFVWYFDLEALKKLDDPFFFMMRDWHIILEQNPQLQEASFRNSEKGQQLLINITKGSYGFAKFLLGKAQANEIFHSYTEKDEKEAKNLNKNAKEILEKTKVFSAARFLGTLADGIKITENKEEKIEQEIKSIYNVLQYPETSILTKTGAREPIGPKSDKKAAYLLKTLGKDNVIKIAEAFSAALKQAEETQKSSDPSNSNIIIPTKTLLQKTLQNILANTNNIDNILEQLQETCNNNMLTILSPNLPLPSPTTSSISSLSLTEEDNKIPAESIPRCNASYNLKTSYTTNPKKETLQIYSKIETALQHTETNTEEATKYLGEFISNMTEQKKHILYQNISEDLQDLYLLYIAKKALLHIQHSGYKDTIKKEDIIQAIRQMPAFIYKDLFSEIESLESRINVHKYDQKYVEDLKSMLSIAQSIIPQEITINPEELLSSDDERKDFNNYHRTGSKSSITSSMPSELSEESKYSEHSAAIT